MVQEQSTQLSEGTTSLECVADVPPNGFVFVEMLRKEQAANKAKIIQITRQVNSCVPKREGIASWILDCRASKTGHSIVKWIW